MQQLVSLFRKELIELGKVGVKENKLCNEMVSVPRKNRQHKVSEAVTKFHKVENIPIEWGNNELGTNVHNFS